MTNEIKMITFDLDDTLWDNKPTITNAEIKTRKWIEEKVGAIEWGDLNDFLQLREALIRKDKSIAWDISKLRIEIFKEKIKGLVSNDEITKLAEEAFSYFLKKRHEIELFPGVEDALKALSENYMLGVLTNGNADIYKLSIGKYFEFSISSLEAQNSKPNKSHFELAKSHLPNLKYNEMLHIGDHQINDILGAHTLGIEVLWFNNTRAMWEQDFEKPDQFYDWQNLAKIIEEKYESR
jgi:HAD superfamily hydrolase (TIGR01549 family)